MLRADAKKSDGAAHLGPGAAPRIGQSPAAESALAELLERVQRGERGALPEFVLRFGPLIRRRVRGKLSPQMRSTYDSTDVLATLLRRLDKFVKPEDLRATDEREVWMLLLKVIQGALSDQQRRLARRTRAEHAWVRAVGTAPGTLSDPATWDADCGSDAEALLAQLTDPIDREIVDLRVRGMELQVIATRLGLSAGAVRARWLRIRARLSRPRGRAA
ncbi:MAG: RNA polymerase sigma factor [Phycisphaerales bacterium]